jgi:hypothetical protein
MKDLPIDKFTQEVKDAWIEALESGEYVQCQYELENKSKLTNDTHYCCLGVLGAIHDKLDNDLALETDDDDISSINESPYDYLYNTINKNELHKLIQGNDSTKLIKPDYSNVLSLIKSLKVQI